MKEFRESEERDTDFLLFVLSYRLVGSNLYYRTQIVSFRAQDPLRGQGPFTPVNQWDRLPESPFTELPHFHFFSWFIISKRLNNIKTLRKEDRNPMSMLSCNQVYNFTLTDVNTDSWLMSRIPYLESKLPVIPRLISMESFDFSVCFIYL